MMETTPTEITNQKYRHPLNPPALYQDVFCLIDLFEGAYQYCEVESALALEGFFTALRDLMDGMAFWCLHDFRTRRCFKQCRAVFNDYLQNQTPEQPERLIRFFSAIGHLVQYGVKSLRESKYPEAYDCFLEHLELALNPEGIRIEHQAKVALLLKQLKESKKMSGNLNQPH